MPVCDGCGLEVGEAHIRQRIERLELATRFRPIHIQVLFVDSAPPLRLEDFFYRPAKDRSFRSVGSRMYFDEIMKCLGPPSSRELKEESALADFQRRGYFLVHAVECPVENDEDLEESLRRHVPGVVRRVQSSYKPKSILLLSQPTYHLVEPLQSAGWDGRLILDNGEPFVDPFLGDPQNQAEFGTALGDRLLRALPSS